MERLKQTQGGTDQRLRPRRLELAFLWEEDLFCSPQWDLLNQLWERFVASPRCRCFASVFYFLTPQSHRYLLLHWKARQGPEHSHPE